MKNMKHITTNIKFQNLSMGQFGDLRRVHEQLEAYLDSRTSEIHDIIGGGDKAVISGLVDDIAERYDKLLHTVRNIKDASDDAADDVFKTALTLGTKTDISVSFKILGEPISIKLTLDIDSSAAVTTTPEQVQTASFMVKQSAPADTTLNDSKVAATNTKTTSKTTK